MKQTLVVFLMAWCSCAVAAAQTGAEPVTMDRIAERYVRLALQVGQYSPDLVDSYSGPPEWKAEAEKGKKPVLPYAELRDTAAALLKDLESRRASCTADLDARRWNYLHGQVSALAANIELLNGKKMTFDEESAAIYHSVAELHDENYFAGHLKKLDALLPAIEGKNLQERLFSFREKYKIPRDKVEAVFAAAIAECRKRSQAFARLPDNENFQTEFVTGKPWSAYNWYKGNAFSLIQVNLDMPQYIDVPLALAAHEGYPGHHVYNALLENLLQKGKNWVEFSIYLLFSPQSLIAEGTAEYALEMIFTREEKLDFYQKTLFPLAGFDPTKAQEYLEVMELSRKLNDAMTEAARRFIDGKMNGEQVVDFLMKYNLVPRDRAEKKLAFIKQYRSYVLNYTLGEDLVRAYMESAGERAEERPEDQAGRTASRSHAAAGKTLTASETAETASVASARQARFLRLLTQPVVPADLAVGPAKTGD